jgi:cytoskeletal protein CcmA (bactofilin family)
MGRKPEQIGNEAPTPGQAPLNAPAISQPVQPPVAESNTSSSVVVERPKPLRAFTENESLARDLKDGTVSGFVGAGTMVHGEAVFKGMMRIDGQLSGSVKSEKGTLIVSSGGRVEATIEVAVANINGRINGDIIATERIELGRTAHVTGNIQAPSLVIEQGAIFEGSCRMTQAQKASQANHEHSYSKKKRDGATEGQSSSNVGVITSAESKADQNGSNVSRIAG